MDVNFGDKNCCRCGDEYFSDTATEEMEKHNLCFNCILEFNKKNKHEKSTLESFAEGIREASHYKI